jgi:hypothetical protein
LSHNIASSYENNNHSGGGLGSNHGNSDSVGSLRIMGDASVISGGVSNIRKPAPGQVGKAPNAPRKDNSPPGM